MNIISVALAYVVPTTQWSTETLGVKTGIFQEQPPLPEY